MIQITLERKTQNSNAGPNKNELDERDVHCRENLKQL
ncbi:hypothetical protein T05_5375 [Trichinella murrelli]|uniref:Uncharacterized protein n=1 Tax=Trichinella murrelli TaxID=144512 RepID=A0A0V0STD7_9BILA|nr:hypothetical protein T05_5375 [Trichinella murrelli]